MLSQLAGEYFARSPLLILPAIALFIFFAVFVCVSVRAFAARSDHMQRMAELPIADSEVTRHG
jgi:hypothetical protein